MSAGRLVHLVLVIGFWGLVITLYVWWRVRERRDASEGEIERKALVERLLRPDWQFYERHLQRPAPTALRELFADRKLVTSCGLEFTKDDGISSFNPLEEDSLVDTADQLGFDVVPFATSDCGDAIFLRPGMDEPDTVYISYHDDPGKGVLVLADSVAAMLERLRNVNDAV
jgi:hypothetical protein